ncbi:MAG: hypothetical protein ACYSWZ_11450 [Planctomycetota bacterium]
MGATKREGIGGVISILDSPAVAKAVAGLRCWIRELANYYLGYWVPAYWIPA